MREDGRVTTPRSTPTTWVRAHLPELLVALLLLCVLPMRDLWAPDEPDFAQCVKEMRLRGAWLLPYLNGVPYSEKPILYYWVMKASAVGLDFLTGGLGFTQGVAAWALRLPSAVAAVAFLSAFRRWAARFLFPDTAQAAAWVLASAPLWFWQSQFIQIDLLFSAMLAWAWLCWLAGYLLLREQLQAPAEASRWFLRAYVWLALAILAKGPLAPVLSLLLMLSFLLWERNLAVLPRTRLGLGLVIVLLPVSAWYLAAGLAGGPRYAYELIVMQNFGRAVKAWDHIQPWWKYGEYLLGDFFPWVLLLPAAALHLWRDGLRDPARRFLFLAFLVPFLFLSLVQSKQGKYLLMAHPFLALWIGDLIAHALPPRVRRLGVALALGLALPTLALAAIGLGAGGAKLQAQVAAFQGPLRLMTLGLALGLALVLLQIHRGRGQALVASVALGLGLLYLVGGTWGFHRLDDRKSHRRWATAVMPLIQGRQVFYWQTMRSGVMVYTDHLMPELRNAEALRKLDPEARLVAQGDEWATDAWGMTPDLREQFEVVLRVPTGGDDLLLLRRTP